MDFCSPLPVTSVDAQDEPDDLDTGTYISRRISVFSFGSRLRIRRRHGPMIILPAFYVNAATIISKNKTHPSRYFFPPIKRKPKVSSNSNCFSLQHCSGTYHMYNTAISADDRNNNNCC